MQLSMLKTKSKSADTISTVRDELRAKEDVRFIDRTEFCHLLISARTLNRCDIPKARVRGVFDVNAGVQFLIEEEELFKAV